MPTNITKARSYMLCYVCEKVRDKIVMHLANSEWIIDSGSTFHCCNDRKAFDTYRKVHTHVTIPNGSLIRVHGIGTVGDLNNVHHIPEFKVNLLSVQQLVTEGYTITFLPDKTVIITDERDVSHQLGTFRDVSYLTGEQAKSEQTGQPAGKQAQQVQDRRSRHTIQVPYSELQHNRWGHAFILKIQLAQKNQLIRGFTYQICAIKFCDACASAKLHYTTPSKTPGLGNVQKPTNKFEKIVADIKGPFPRGINGIRYYILFIDYVTRKKFIYFLRTITADDVLETFKNLQLKLQSMRAETKAIRVFKSDKAGQFIDNKVVTYMQQQGITCTRVSPYTHHQQGLVERAHLTLSEMAMSWMLAAYVPKFLWPYAYDHAVLITDMLPTSALGEHTSPYIEAYGHIPDGSHLRTFGCDI